MTVKWFRWALGAAASVLLAGAASAGGSMKDAPAAPCCDANWSGLYLGAAVGYGMASTELDVNHQYWDYDNGVWESPTHLFNLDGLSSQGATGTLTVGYDRQVHPGLVIGVFGDYTFGDLDTDVTLNIFDAFTARLGAHLGDTWSVGARIGLVRSCCTMWYALAGYTQSELGWDLHVDGYKVASGSEDLKGYFIGGGVEQQLGRGLSLKLEYRFTSFDGVRIGSYYFDEGMQRINLDTETDVHSVRLGVSWKFGLDHRAEAAPLK
jgi:outer membrane immunogenic protein